MTTTQTQFLSELKALLRKWQAEIHVDFDPDSTRDKMIAFVGDEKDWIDLGNCVSYEKVPEFSFSAYGSKILPGHHSEEPNAFMGTPKITPDPARIELVDCNLTTGMFWDMITILHKEESVDCIFSVTLEEKRTEKNPWVFKGNLVSLSETPGNCSLVVQLVLDEP